MFLAVKVISKFINSYKKKFQTEFNIGPNIKLNHKVNRVLNILNKYNDDQVKIFYLKKNFFKEKNYLSINTKKFQSYFNIKYSSNLENDLYFTNQIYLKILKNDKNNLINLFEDQLRQF